MIVWVAFGGVFALTTAWRALENVPGKASRVAHVLDRLIAGFLFSVWMVFLLIT